MTIIRRIFWTLVRLHLLPRPYKGTMAWVEDQLRQQRPDAYQLKLPIESSGLHDRDEQPD